MKLVPIFTGLLCVANSQESGDEYIETIIKEALSKVYSPTETGFKIKIEPYISGEVNYKNLEEIGFYGTLGKVDFQAFYNQQNCDATIKSGTENYPGIVKNLPGYNYFFHESMWDYTFENTHKLELPCFSDNFDNYEIKYSSEGKINGENFDTRLSLSLDEFVVTSKKYAGTVVFKGTSEFSDNFPSEIKPELPSSFNVEVTPSVKVECGVNPFSKSCSADMKVYRVVNDNDLPAHSFSWKGSSGVFTIQEENKVVFKLQVKYGKYWVVNYLCKKEICDNFANGYYTTNSMSHLITVPSEEAIPDIAEAVAQISEIFMRIYGELKSSTRYDNYERVGQFALYFDQFARVLTEEKDAFDCSQLVRASGFEWPALANYWQVESVQSYGQQVCVNFNYDTEVYLMERFSPRIENGRMFLRNVLSGEAEASFGEWTNYIVY